ncbi:response regulator [candidate division CSSED10-310 bacterium]|uniref:Response regulator n=1 Tax=candidate division CSSED10-310 bacterium TaxID=2855610 RepID=A0ABV6YVM3_UNCC1
MTNTKSDEVIVFSEDPLSSDALKFALESKGIKVSSYEDLRSGLKHIVLNPPHLVIIDEIITGPKPGDIVSGIRKKLTDFTSPFLFILNPPLTGKDIHGYIPEIDGYIERPYSLDGILHTVFTLLQKKVPAEQDATVSLKKNFLDGKDISYDPELMSFVAEESAAHEVPNGASKSAPPPPKKQSGEWIDNLQPLDKSEATENISMIQEEEAEEITEVIRTAPPQARPEAQRIEETRLKGYKGTVLIIDDEPFIIRILKTIVEAEGYRALSADNGLDGLKKCQEIIPDIILVDLMMPELDGYEFIEIIRTEEGFEKIPIVILSARPLTKDQGQAFKLGANFYMQKPIDRGKLLGVIQNLISETDES